MITFKLEGVAELQAKLKEMGAELGQKTIRTAARKAFKPVLEAAKTKAPVDTGVLRDSIVIATTLPKGGDSVVAVGLTVRKNKAAAGDKRKDASWRWHFTEKGTRFHAAHPFLRPALDSNAERVAEDFRKELEQAITKAIAKAAKGKK